LAGRGQLINNRLCRYIDQLKPNLKSPLEREVVRARTGGYLQQFTSLLLSPYPLNSEQLEAFLHHRSEEKPLVILAGAGSGKTTVMTRKIALLIASGTDPSRILGLTFTRRSAREMKNRLMKLISENSFSSKGNSCFKYTKDINLPWVTTFHAAGLKLLRLPLGEKQSLLAGCYAPDYSKGFDLLTESERQEMTKDLTSRLGFSTHFASEVFKKANKLTESLHSFEKSYTPNSDLEFEACRFLELYKQVKIEQGVLDLQDLIAITAHLLRSDQNIRSNLQNRFDFILVDEFQDTNFAQLTLLAHLAGKEKHIFAVGDDYQAIYEWRGAKPGFIRDFSLFFPDAKKIRLTSNYRSRTRILLAADSLFLRDKKKARRFLRPTRRVENGKLDFGDKLALFEARDGSEERDFLIFKLKDLHEKESIDYSKMAVFYRTQRQKEPLISDFKRAGIPYRVLGGEHFFKLAVPRKLIYLCRILDNLKVGREKSVSISDSANLNGALKNWWFAAPAVYADDSDFICDDTDYLTLFKNKLRDPSASTYSENFVCENIEKLLEWKTFLKAGNSFSELMPGIEKHLKIYRSRQYTKQFLRFERWLKSEQLHTPRNIIEKSIIAGGQPDVGRPKNPAVNLMTLHGCKGLEFDIVFIIGLEEGICPCSYGRSEKKNKEKWLKEEKRLFYVGMTRARNGLFLSYALTRDYGSGKIWRKPSRFLRLIPSEFIQKQPAYLSLLEKAKYLFSRLLPSISKY
jgi:DNA helicase-2/ATP-dependent DNA helicase PcrA